MYIRICRPTKIWRRIRHSDTAWGSGRSCSSSTGWWRFAADVDRRVTSLLRLLLLLLMTSDVPMSISRHQDAVCLSVSLSSSLSLSVCLSVCQSTFVRSSIQPTSAVHTSAAWCRFSVWPHTGQWSVWSFYHSQTANQPINRSELPYVWPQTGGAPAERRHVSLLYST